MKKIRKVLFMILSLTIALCLTLSVGFACDDTQSGGPSETVDKGNSFQGTHVFTATDTDKEFIKNGRTNYKIVLPMDESQMLGYAKTEFIWLFKEATGITISTTKDSGMTHAAGQKFISLGRTSLLESSGIIVDKNVLGEDGIRIVTKDENIYICGGADVGTVYGVYDFFQIAFNYIYVYIDAFEIDRNVRNLNLKNFDVTDIPDIAKRSGGAGWEKTIIDPGYASFSDDIRLAGLRGRDPFETSTYMAGSLRYVKNPTTKVYDIGTTGAYEGRILPTLNNVNKMHNDLDLLAPDVYKGDHPTWFSAGGDLCFTAGGIEEEYQAMVDEVAFRFFESIMAYRTSSARFTSDLFNCYILPLTLEDGVQACACSKCVEMTNKYGQMSSTLIRLMNDVADRLFGPEGYLEAEKAKCEADPNYYFVFEPESLDTKLRYEDYYRDDYVITFFAYGYVADAPCTKDENGNWHANAPEMYLKDRIVPWLAYQNGNQFDFYDDEFLKNRFKNRIESWSTVAGDNGVMYYEYPTCYGKNSQNPDGTFQGMTPELYNFLAANGCKDLFCDSRYYSQPNTYPSSFYTMLYYLRRNLAWNSSLDYSKLVDDYFRVMFGDAQDTMYKLYLYQRDHAAHNWNCDDLFQTDTSALKYYGYQTILDWEEFIVQARKDIEPLKEADPKAYELYSGHIDGEWLVVGQHILYYHKQKITTEKVTEYKQELERIVNYWRMANGACASGSWITFLNSI